MTIKGLAGSEVIEGTEGRDDLFGTDGDDTLRGLGGDDYLAGERGDDVLLGGDGDDYLDRSFGNDSLDGGAGDDFLVAGYGQDTLTGGSGLDFFWLLSTQEGARFGVVEEIALVTDLEVGETISIGPRGQTGTEVLGFPTLRFAGRSAFSGAAGELRYGTDDGFTVIEADWDGDREADAIARFVGEFDLRQVDPIAGGARFEIDEAYRIVREGDVRAGGSRGDDVIVGGKGNDALRGAGGDDSLTGGVGDDVVAGGFGDDTILGGEGADYLIAGAGRDVVEGGAGNDLLTMDDFDQMDVADVTITDDAVGFGAAGQRDDRGVQVSGVETIILSRRQAGAVADRLDASGASVEVGLYGGGASDTLMGGAGSDTIEGDTGADVMSGGRGADVFDVDDLIEIGALTEDGGVLPDRILDFEPADTLDLFGMLGTTGGELLFIGDDAFTGTDGEVRFDRRDGATRLEVFDFGDVFTILIEGGEFDLAETAPGSLVFVIDADAEGTAGEDELVGSNGDDALSAEGGADTLYGLAGDDALVGGAGADLLIGGVGVDELRGGAGDDVLYGDGGA